MQYLTVKLKYCIMENSINQRIREFINSLGVNDNQFAKSIGITQSVIASMFSRNTEPSSKVIVSILNAYANLSAEWLMRGEGRMLKEERADNVNLPNSNFSIFTIREIGDKTTFERSVAINMNQVRAIEDHATTCRIIMVDGKEYEILCDFSDFIKR